MTAITLNLLAEEKMAQQANARDPLKWAVAAATMIVAITVGMGALLSWLAGQRNVELNAVQTRWDSMSASSQGSGSPFQQMKSMADDFLDFNHTRVLCAPQLAWVKDVITDTVQLTRLSFTVNTDVQEIVAAPVDGGGKEEKRRRPAPRSVEHLVLRLDGKAISGRPEMEVDALIQALRNDPQFREQLQDIKLKSIARVVVNTENSASAAAAAVFVVECQFKERK